MSGYDTQYGAGMTASSPGFDHGHDHVVDGLLRAGRDEDLGSRVLEPVVAPELGRDRVLELGGALDRRVTREPAADRRDAGIRDVHGRVEIRFADAKPDDVAAFGAQPDDTAVEGDGGRGLDALDALRKGDWHGGFPRTQSGSVS